MNCAYEDQEKREIACGKALKPPVCPECGMFLVAKPKNGYIEFHCGGVLDGCNYSYVVGAEK